MLWMIGLGLHDGKDISVRGKEAVNKADAVFLEGYTSILQCSHEELEKELGVGITFLGREDVEQNAEKILSVARKTDAVVLFVGDPFAATTHADLYLRARKEEIEVRVIHNASVINAVGAVGLELYKYGRTVSVPYWQPGYEPTSFLEGIKKNIECGLHTLCLLDIKSDEKRYMSVKEGVEHLLKAERVTENNLINEQLPVIGVARLGSPDQKIVAGTLAQIKDVDFGNPPHCMVIPGHLHPVEEEMLELWGIEE